MQINKRFLLGAMLLAFFAGLCAEIKVKAIYPPTFYDSMMVEDGLMVTTQIINDNYCTMKVYNSQDPASPELLSTTTVRHAMPRDQRLYRSHVYIPDLWGHRLRRYSLLNPESPVLNYEYAFNMVGYRDMAFSGNYLYMATQSLGLRVVDIANENSAIEVGHFASGDPLFRVWAQENRAAVLSYNLASEIAVVKMLDISNPVNPVFTGVIELPGYYYNDPIEIVFYQDLLYLSRFATSTKVYNLQNPGNPLFVGNLEYGFTYSLIQDDVRYCNSGGFFRIQHLTNPLAPADIATFEIRNSTEQHYIIDLPYVYLITDGVSFCLDLSDLSPSEHLIYTYDTRLGGNALAESQNRLYYNGTIAQLTPQGDLYGPQPCAGLVGVGDIKADQGILHTINSGGMSCSLYSINDPDNPILLSTIPGNATESFLFGEYIFIRSSSGIRCFSISDVTEPIYLFTLNENAKTLTMTDDIIWIAYQNSLITYRITNRQALQICSHALEVSPTAFTHCLAKRGDYIYISGARNEILVYDVSDPYATVYAGHALLPMPYDASDRAPWFTSDGNMLIVTGLANQGVLYDLSDPSSPEYLDHQNLPCKPISIVFSQDSFLFKRSNIIYCMQTQSPSAASDPVLIPGPRLSAGPNPFSESVSLTIELNETKSGSIQRPEIQIYNIKGQKVRTLFANSSGQGPHSVTWDGRDKSGTACPNGIYLARFRVDGHNKGCLRLSLIK